MKEHLLLCRLLCSILLLSALTCKTIAFSTSNGTLPQEEGQNTYTFSFRCSGSSCSNCHWITRNYVEMETEGNPKDVKTRISNLFWHGGSAYDAWFSCASNQVAQVLLTLPYSFSQLGMLSGILFQIFYGLLGSWTAYLISILYVEYRTRKERERVDFRNHVIQFVELHGDRAGYDDPAIVTGLGTINGRSYMFMGHQKGRNTKENIQRNFGMPTPHGYRKAMRMMYYADHHGFPIVTFIDTPGAFADLKSEELGQGEAIAHNLRTMFGLKVPIISIVIGEGGSGGALAIGCANKLLMLENAVFYVASPEACAAILWKSAKASPKAAEKLKITAGELCKLQICDGIIPEPLGGGHADPHWTSQQIKIAIVDAMDELTKMDTQELLKHRMLKFRKLGGFQEGIPIDPKRKVNMKMKEEPIFKPGKTLDLELEGEVEKLKQKILKASESSTESPELGLNEMIDKLKREVDHEFSEAAKALGLKDRFVMLREEFAKARNSKDQPMNLDLKDKIEKLKDEFNQGLPGAPNYARLKYKLDMLEEISKAKNLSENNNKTGSLKQEINKKFKEVLGQPDMKNRIDALKKEIEDSGISTFAELNQGMKEKILQVKEEIETEFADVLESLGLHVEPRSFSDVKDKIEELNEEINQVIEDVINSSDLKNKIEQLKLEVAKAGKTLDSESKSKIMVLEQQIKQCIAEAMDSSVLKEKHEKLKAEISEALESSGGLDGSLIKGNVKEGNSKFGGSRVEVNFEANRSFA